MREHIGNNTPIEFLVPYGGVKTVYEEKLDVSELASFKQLIKLNNKIKMYYKPGAHFSIRIEDTGARWLFNTDHINIYNYTRSIVDLIDIMKVNDIISPIPESTLMTDESYFDISEKRTGVIYDYLKNIASLEDLYKIGWVGTMSEPQIAYYMNRYEILYPGETEKNLYRLAKYFGGSLARYQLNGTAKPNTSYIDLKFTTPIPGAPLAERSVYYKVADGRTSLPPWRGKGFIEIDKTNACFKMCSWRDIPSDIISNIIVLEGDSKSLAIKADYVIKV